MKLAAPKINIQSVSFLFSCSTALLFFLIASGSLSFWKVSTVQDIPSLRFTLPVFLVLLISCFAWFKKTKSQIVFSNSGFLFSLIVVFLTDWFTRRYNFFLGAEMRGEIILFSVLGYVYWYRLRNSRVWKWLLAFLVIALIGSFYVSSGGYLLFSDDHPVFFYRLSLLKENFPNIPVYTTLWSAGRDTMHLFATGCLNVFLLLLPVIYLFDLSSSYNWIVSALLFVGVPTSVMFASRLSGFNKKSSYLSAILALTSSSFWYVWGLKYGTLGFITSICLLPIVLALLNHALDRHKRFGLKEFAILTPALTLMLFWSPSGIVLLPVICWGILRWKRLFVKPNFIWAAAFVCLFSFPWIVLFWSGWNVSSFLDSKPTSYSQLEDKDYLETKPQKSFKHQQSFDLSEGLKVFRETSTRANPILLILGLPSLIVLGWKQGKIWILTSSWLLFLGTICVPLAPQLEFDRMLVVLFFLLSIPVGDYCLSVFSANLPKIRFLGSVLFGFILTGIFSTLAISGNRTLDRFSFQSQQTTDLSEVLSEVSRGGRVLFSGFLLHDLDGGHLAPLASMTSIPTIASSHLHDKWKYEQVFPKQILDGGVEKVVDYLRLYNVDTVLAHEKKWIEFFKEHKGYFEALDTVGKFHLFGVRSFNNSYFLSGQGEVDNQTSNGFSVTPKSRNLELKFRYYPWLKTGECKLDYVERYSEKFIKLKDCPKNKTIRIEAPTFFDRLVFEVSK